MRFARNFIRRYGGGAMAVALATWDRLLPKVLGGAKEATSRKTGEQQASGVCSCATESVRHDAALQLCEQQLDLVIESAKDTALLMLDTAGGISSWNSAAKRILGYDAEEIVGQNVSRLYLDEDVASDRPKQDLEAAIREGRYQHECRRLRQDGSPFWAMVATMAKFDAQGRHIGFSSVIRDISERKNTAEIARGRVELLRFFIGRAPASVAMLDSEMRYVAVSQRWLEDYGLVGQSLEGKNHYDVFPALPEYWKEVYRRCLTGTPERGREDPRVRADGTVQWLRWQVRPWYAKLDVTVGGIVIFSEDITSRKEAEIQLRASEARYRQVVDFSLECIWIASGGRIVFANRQVSRLFGCDSPEDLVGRPPLDFVHPDDHDRAAEHLELGQIGEATRLQQLRFLGDGDRVITLEIQAVCLEYEGTLAVMAVARDVSERRSLESELFHAQKMEAIGQLTGGIAHDFNNILTVITGSIEILADAVAANPIHAKVAKIVEEAAWRGADLTQRLLAFARRQPLQPRVTDVNALIVDTAKLLRATLGQQIEIESMLQDDLRSALVDPSQLSAALINLALNARDAMPDGGKLVIETDHVYLDELYAETNREVRPGPYVMIALSDTGHGIAPALLSKVFEPFFTTKPVGRGTGLGLSMVYGFAKQSGGHIKIYSEEGHGTTIRLYLPQADRIAQLADDAAPLVPAAGGTESILVVEDDGLVRDYVAAQLNSLGYTVLTAGNAAEALVVIDSTVHLDLLFTDVIMPGAMNGRLLADEALKRRPSLKVLFTSGYTENAIIHHGRLDPGVLLLSKPYRKSDLARLVREAIGRRSS